MVIVEVICTKQRDLVRLLEKNGWWLKRHGGDHDTYTNGIDSERIPRHKEIKETLAKAIIKRRNLRIPATTQKRED